MKNILHLIVLLTFTVSAQKSSYNIFEIGKGEILKKNYEFLDHLFNDLFVAEPVSKEEDSNENSGFAGVIDSNENVILPFQYRNVRKVRNYYGPENKSLISVSNGRAFALFKITSNYKVNRLTDFYIYKFGPFVFDSNSIALDKGLYQIYNLKTNNFIKTESIDVEPLNEHLIAVRNLDYKWGVMNDKGELVQTHKYGMIRCLTDSTIMVEAKDSIGVLNRTGKLILFDKFRYMRSYGNLIIAKAFNNKKSLQEDNNSDSHTKTGLMVIEHDSDSLRYYSADDSHQLKEVDLSGAYHLTPDGALRLVIPFNYQELTSGLNGNLIAVKNFRYGIINSKGQALLPFEYQEIEIPLSSLYLVKKNNKYGVVNQNLREIIPIEYQNIFPISKNTFWVKKDLQWYKAHTLSNHLQKLTSVNKSEFYNFDYLKTYNKSLNEMVVNTEFFIIRQNGRYGIINKRFSIIIKPIYRNEPSIPKEGFFKIENDNEVLFFNSKGKLLLNQASELGFIAVDNLKNVIICKKDNNFGVINTKGKVVIPFIYTYIEHARGKKFIVERQLSH